MLNHNSHLNEDESISEPNKCNHGSGRQSHYGSGRQTQVGPTSHSLTWNTSLHPSTEEQRRSKIRTFGKDIDRSVRRGTEESGGLSSRPQMPTGDILSPRVLENEGSVHSKGFTNGNKIVRSHTEEVNKGLGRGLIMAQYNLALDCNLLTFPYWWISNKLISLAKDCKQGKVFNQELSQLSTWRWGRRVLWVYLLPCYIVDSGALLSSSSL